MSTDLRTEVTRIIHRIRDGQGDAAELMPLLYSELRAIAQNYMRKERADHTLQATALVNEAFLRMVDQSTDLEGRAHFMAVAANAMRRILVDHARARSTQKRHHRADRVTLSSVDVPMVAGVSGIDLIALDDALEHLARLHQRQARVVELRFFAGLTTEEVARVLHVSLSTVEADWRMARAWLAVQLKERDSAAS